MAWRWSTATLIVVVRPCSRQKTKAGLHGVRMRRPCDATNLATLASTDIWSRIRTERERHSLASVSEDLGLVLLEACLNRYGTLEPPFGEARLTPR